MYSKAEYKVNCRCIYSRVTTECRGSASFYRATLCVSADFAVARCLSVRLSAAFVYCIQTAEDVVKLLSRHGNPIILVFRTRAPVPNSKGTLSAGAQYTRVWENFQFSTVIAVYLGKGTRQAYGCYGTLIGSHRWRIDPCRFR